MCEIRECPALGVITGGISLHIEPTGVTNGPSDWGRDSAAASFSQWCTFSVCLPTFILANYQGTHIRYTHRAKYLWHILFSPASANAAAVWLITECIEGKKCR